MGLQYLPRGRDRTGYGARRRSTPSWEPVEPMGSEPAADEDEEEAGAGEQLGHLALLDRVTDLRPQALVDLGEIGRRRRLEEATARDLRDRGKRLRIGRHVELS